MSEAVILFSKPGAVRPSDKGALRKIGVIVVEVENLDDVRLVRPERAESELPHGDLLNAYASALRKTHDGNFTKEAKVAVANAICDALMLRHGAPS